MIESYVNKWTIFVDNELFTRTNLLRMQGCTSRAGQAQSQAD
jgi:hypothetical protein